MRLLTLIAIALFAIACANAGPGSCGDALCRPGEGESCTTCSVDCGSCAGCGDGTCNPGSGESCSSCLADCGGCAATCGDGTCNGAEVCSTCPGDCGACSGSCSAATCAGCCAAGVCSGGTAPSACGTGGNICMTCGTGLTCSGGACVVDPTSRWNIVLERLTVPSTNYAGAAWDALGGAPDPVVDVVVGSDTATPVRQNGPDDVFTVNYPGTPTVTNARASDLRAYLAFVVSDEDVTDYERISACYVAMVDAAFSGTTQTTNCPLNAASAQSGYMLTWHLEPF